MFPISSRQAALRHFLDVGPEEMVTLLWLMHCRIGSPEKANFRPVANFSPNGRRVAKGQAMWRDRACDERARTDHAVVADLDAAHDCDIRADPGVLSESNRLSPLWMVGVEGVLIGIEYSGAGAHPCLSAQFDEFLGADMTGVEPALRPHNQTPIPHGAQVNRAEIGVEPCSRPYIDFGIGVDTKADGVASPLSINIRTNSQSGTRRELESGEYQIC